MKKELRVNNAQYNAVYERFMDKFPEVSKEEHAEFVRVEGLLNFRGVMLRAQMQKFFGDVQWFESDDSNESNDKAKLLEA